MSSIKIEIKKKCDKYLFIIIFIFLLILRFPLPIITRLFRSSISSDAVILIYTNGTYFLTAVLILLMKDKLAIFKINKLALIIFLLTPILRPIVFISVNEQYPWNTFLFTWFNIIVSLVVCFCLIISHTKIHNDNL